MLHIERILELAEDERSLLLDNLGGLQLNIGCNVGCNFCYVSPSSKVTDYIPFSLLEGLAAVLPKKKRNPLRLYGASDTFNWHEGGKDAKDLLDMLKRNEVTFLVKTAVPEGQEDLVLACLNEGHPLKISTSRFRQLYPEFKDLPPMIRRIIRHPNSSVDIDLDYYEDPNSGLYASGRGVKTVPRRIDLEVSGQHDVYTNNVALGRVLNPGASALNGVFISPEGVFNKTVIPFCKEYPFGEYKEPINLDDPQVNSLLLINSREWFLDDDVDAINLHSYVAWLGYPDTPFVQVRETLKQRLTPREASIRRLKAVLGHDDEVVRKIRYFLVRENIDYLKEKGMMNPDIMDFGHLFSYLMDIGKMVAERFGNVGFLNLQKVIEVYRNYWATADLLHNYPMRPFDDKKTRQGVNAYLGKISR